MSAQSDAPFTILDGLENAIVAVKFKMFERVKKNLLLFADRLRYILEQPIEKKQLGDAFAQVGKYP